MELNISCWIRCRSGSDAVRGSEVTCGSVPQHGTYQNNTSKIFVLQKKAIRAIKFNNLAYNEHTNAYFKCNKILKLSDQYKLQASNYVFQVLHSSIDEEIKSSLLINNQIHSHNKITNNHANEYFTRE